ncbi:hypothetical protein BV25DRAFT_134456 [Artomyces pyxidatus]|uniref:Uncharacterized protein n=1 Tax=Artomyces pyxidatus TaxID=48021 RepID=A0ACB8T999_9AGAM|nr:hypothetical protein BV25DRAFT_134456 [Artomyces pyxidatus]
MNTAAFGSVDTHAIAAVSHDLASACYQPMTTWNLHGLSPSTTSDDQPAAQKRRARRSSYCNTNFGPLSFVPLAEHEDGLRHKYHSATSPLPAPKLESNAPLDDVHPLRFEALSAKTHRRCSAVSRLATRKSSTGVLQPGALSNNAFQALTQDHPPGLRPGGGYELSDEAGNNPSDARPPATRFLRSRAGHVREGYPPLFGETSHVSDLVHG